MDHYSKFRADIPSNTWKYISRYDLMSEAIQFLQQNNPDVVTVFDLDLRTAQTFQAPMEINVPGRAFTIYGYSYSSKYNTADNTGVEVSEPSAFVSVRINASDPSRALSVKHNRGFRGDFQKLFLSWPAQDNVGAKLVIFKYDSCAYNTNESDNRFNSVEASNIETPAAVTVTNVATQIVAADSSRKCATIMNLGSVDLYVGDSTITTSKGTKLIPNAVLFYRNTAALYGVTGTSTSVGVNEEY